LEELGDGDWGPAWPPDRIDRVRSTLDEIHACAAPAGLPSLREREPFTGWRDVTKDPGGFLRLRLCSTDWLEQALPTLIEAEAAAPLDGPDLCHLDVRSDNICFLGDRTVFVDWNWACVGNGRMDLVSWLPSLHIEGGPLPDALCADEPELTAAVAGFFAHRAPLPTIPTAPRVRAVQRAQLRVALPWAARMLGLSEPDSSISR
jgi:thiamine kinase-like enzyme